MELKHAKILTPLLVVSLIAFAAPLAGCEEQGPAEQTGEAIDEAAEDARRGVEDATD